MDRNKTKVESIFKVNIKAIYKLIFTMIIDVALIMLACLIVIALIGAFGYSIEFMYHLIAKVNEALATGFALLAIGVVSIYTTVKLCNTLM